MREGAGRRGGGRERSQQGSIGQGGKRSKIKDMTGHEIEKEMADGGDGEKMKKKKTTGI